ncbi:MAG: tRNA (adenosine(37)-N6)-dimethylallyltransferase MiaA [Clostridia bacterium]|nr:tRNA (adenosine(37)-N6)-dimethylallyltransferase MiaA [Clostridia bacterium]
MPHKIAVVTGPTATGKTRLGVMLSKTLGGEVVSADSMQVYRRMDIGTAKPSPAETRGVPHHLIDAAEPDENYSVARYVEAAGAACDDILDRGLLPIVVGGTGLYIDSLISGRSFALRDDGGICRAELNARFDEIGGVALLRELSQFDPLRAQRLHAADKKRIVRAYEVFLLTGKTITEHDEETKKRPPRYDAAVIALDFKDRADLYARIDARVDAMVNAGLFEEVRALLDSGLSSDCTAMQAIGYKEAAAALRGERSEAEAVELIKKESRRYAKRQLTWLRANPEIFWICWEKEPDFDFALSLSTDFLRSCGIE